MLTGCRELGNDLWRQNPFNKNYDAKLINSRLQALMETQENGDVQGLMYIIRSGIYPHSILLISRSPSKSGQHHREEFIQPLLCRHEVIDRGLHFRNYFSVTLSLLPPLTKLSNQLPTIRYFQSSNNFNVSHDTPLPGSRPCTSLLLKRKREIRPRKLRTTNGIRATTRTKSQSNSFLPRKEIILLAE